ncbi:MAG: DUF2065 domain-containing protein [Roseovarius sp.]|nr:DUF2065 domain-containing protein [Roseovarius sp.]MCY4209250.1 DUF2065 domain-containing protein [Roseovarius sp.]MCY4292052.1 DUF2065 domain-containing protein [Roseovarius sp.]MCY4315059.1 DUF2065 domain-containing protein [Roseovarius sp.]
MASILYALGLLLAVEGLIYALAPSVVERLLAMLRSMPHDQRRLMGLLSMAVGALLLWLARSIGN